MILVLNWSVLWHRLLLMKTRMSSTCSFQLPRCGQGWVSQAFRWLLSPNVSWNAPKRPLLMKSHSLPSRAGYTVHCWPLWIRRLKIDSKPNTGDVRGIHLHCPRNMRRRELNILDVWPHLKGVRIEQPVIIFQWVMVPGSIMLSCGLCFRNLRALVCGLLRKQPGLVWSK